MDLIQLVLHNFFSFFVIISVIVFIHEFGHYWVARRCGIKVEAFAIGFGPEIWAREDKHGTRWKLCWFPLGGYVKMFGDEDAASAPDGEKIRQLTEEEKKVALHTQPLWKKSSTVAAGPIANFILAIIIFTFLFSMYGRRETSPEVGTVLENSAAAEAGLQAGDVILRLSNTTVNRFEDIVGLVTISPEMPLEIVWLRDNIEMRGTITPKKTETEDVFGNKVEIGLIGIKSLQTNEYQSSENMPLVPAFVAAVEETWSFSIRTLKVLGQMLTGTRSPKELSGIISIVKYSGDSVSLGFKMVLWFMAILSINLGLINLFPIPMLDGGHLFLYGIEAIRGKPLGERTQEYLFRAGFAMIIMLLVFTVVNDLQRFGIL